MAEMQITEAEFTAAMEAAVAERGENYVYKAPLDGDCVYVDQDGNPSCLIGAAIAKIDPSLLPEWGDFANDGGAAATFGHVLSTHRLALAADQAQNTQDGGGTWGDALENYKWTLAHVNDA